jgi:hypothetical protein
VRGCGKGNRRVPVQARFTIHGTEPLPNGDDEGNSSGVGEGASCARIVVQSEAHTA